MGQLPRLVKRGKALGSIGVKSTTYKCGEVLNTGQTLTTSGRLLTSNHDFIILDVMSPKTMVIARCYITKDKMVIATSYRIVKVNLLVEQGLHQELS